MTNDEPVNIVYDNDDRLVVLIGANHGIQLHDERLTLRYLEKADVKRRLTLAEARRVLNAILSIHNGSTAIVKSLDFITKAMSERRSL